MPRLKRTYRNNMDSPMIGRTVTERLAEIEKQIATLKEQNNLDTLLIIEHADQVIVEKLEYSNHLGSLEIDNLQGQLNIGRNQHGAIPSEKLEAPAKKSASNLTPQLNTDEQAVETGQIVIIEESSDDTKERGANPMDDRPQSQGGQVKIPQPIRKDGAGATDLGPRDVMRDLENPDMLVPPATDAGTVPNLKFSFSDTYMQLNHGGWSREVTVRQLPIATTLAGVNIRLTPGGVRELHWHQQAEWSYMILGRARITAVDQDGRIFIADVSAGDLWYFPPGIPHSIQGLEEGCEFLLVLDDGTFSDLNTLSISDWFAHTPKEVLSANFGVPESAFADIPKIQRYIFQAQVPVSLESQQILSPYGTVPKSFTHRLHAQKPIITSGGSVRIVDSTNFPVSTRIAAALVEIKPGGMREMHWHPNNDEWQYYITGQGRMTVFAGNGTARTFNYRAGDVGYVPFAFGHYIQNTGDQSLWFLEMFKSDRFEDVSLNQWMALTPRQLVQDNLHASSELMNALRKEKWSVVKYS